jgi:hypothetical protein
MNQYTVPFTIRYLEVETGNIYRYMNVCVDILILVYRLCNSIFSVPITKVSKNQQKIKPPQPLYLCILLSNRP